jgi:hypothetical protein
MTKEAASLHLHQSYFITISSKLIRHLFTVGSSMHCTEKANNASRQSMKYPKKSNLYYKIVPFLLLAIAGLKITRKLDPLIATYISRYIYIYIYIYIKVKWFPYRFRVVQSVGRGIALLLHNRGTRKGWVVSSTPRPHFTPGKDKVPILQEAGWAPGPVWTGGKSRPHRDSIPRPSNP